MDEAVTLTFLEIVLGIDNVIFISILAGKLPPGQQRKARTIGLAFALITRILLLLSIKWLMELTKPLGTLFSHAFSGTIVEMAQYPTPFEAAKPVTLYLRAMPSAYKETRESVASTSSNTAQHVSSMP
jgi:predicted tellurium resistance membrane protein TerC